ncbi:hypothetical protein As57867_010236, partial [Aphanomyces stellatus]
MLANLNEHKDTQYGALRLDVHTGLSPVQTARGMADNETDAAFAPSDKIYFYLTWSLAGAFLLFACAAYCYLRRRQQRLLDPLLPNEVVGHLTGLTRDFLEDRSLESTKWTCDICAFTNPRNVPACQLCDSKRELFVLTTPEFGSMEGTVRLDQLTAKQQSARNRRQWQRQVQGASWQWVTEVGSLGHPLSAYFVIGAPSQGHPLQVLPIVGTNSAGLTVLGRQLPRWWFHQLQERQELAFSLKYAWIVAHLNSTYTTHTKITVHRSTIFDESMAALAQAPRQKLCRLTVVTLEGESAIDAGGVTREWYSLLTLAILEPKQGLFITNKTDQSFFINPNSAKDHGPNHLERYLAIGRLLGRAIVDEQVLPFQFSVPLFKALLGYPVSIEDIRYLDPVVYSSLVFVRDCTSDVAELALTFSATLDASTEVDLVPNGRAIEVTCANKAEY